MLCVRVYSQQLLESWTTDERVAPRPIRRAAGTQESEDDGGEDDEVDVPIRRVGTGGGALDTETLEQSWERMQASVASGRAQRLDVQYEVLQR